MAFIDSRFCSIKKAPVELAAFTRKHYSIFYELRLEDIADNIGYFLKVLRSDLKVFMEYPYLDKVYRDSFYSYFATKHKEYPKNCIRLSFFDKSITIKELAGSDNLSLLQKGFFGYCVIRPTKDRVIGRNLINKEALAFKNFSICQHKEEVLVGGRKLTATGFSHSSQDKETISCAETTLWAIMEYFGHKYPEYKPTLPSSILAQLNAQSAVRMLPSNGLTPDQIAFALKAFGFGTQIYSSKDDVVGFMDLLHIYIESGIPVISIIENKKGNSAHAQLIIGRKMPDTDTLSAIVGKKREKLVSFSNCVEQLVFQDDNLPPYQLMPATNPVANYADEDGFAGYRITAFVVPLYKKVYLEAVKARDFFKEGFKQQNNSSAMPGKFLFRMYLASSRSFKSHINDLQLLQPNLKNILLALSLPKFIWCAEFTDANELDMKEVTSLMMLDATEFSDYWKDSFIFAAHKNVSILKIEDRMLAKKLGTTNLEFNEGLSGLVPYYKNLT